MLGAWRVCQRFLNLLKCRNQLAQRIRLHGAAFWRWHIVALLAGRVNPHVNKQAPAIFGYRHPEFITPVALEFGNEFRIRHAVFLSLPSMIAH
jgi:hypothetical protein